MSRTLPSSSPAPSIFNLSRRLTAFPLLIHHTTNSTQRAFVSKSPFHSTTAVEGGGKQSASRKARRSVQFIISDTGRETTGCRAKNGTSFGIFLYVLFVENSALRFRKKSPCVFLKTRSVRRKGGKRGFCVRVMVVEERRRREREDDVTGIQNRSGLVDIAE